MKFVVDQPSLLRELSLLQGTVERKPTLEILSNVLLNALEDGRVDMMATDLEVSYRSAVEAKVERPGSVAVDARRLFDIVKRLPQGSVGFRLEGGQLHISCERIRYRLATQDPELFPPLPEREGNPTGSIGAATLADVMRRVVFVITTEDQRYSLGGALWRLEEDVATFVATDGHRLSLVRRPAKKLAREMRDVVVPRKALVEVGKLAEQEEGEAFFWIEQSNLFVQVGERQVSTHLLEARFPDFEKVIPSSHDKELRIATADLKRAVERVAILSNEQSRMVRFDLEEGQLATSSSHHTLGEAREELSVEYEGKPLAIGFNAQYVLDFLGVCGVEIVQVELGESMSQGLFRPLRADDDEREDLYVVMPMQLG